MNVMKPDIRSHHHGFKLLVQHKRQMSANEYIKQKCEQQKKKIHVRWRSILVSLEMR